MRSWTVFVLLGALLIMGCEASKGAGKDLEKVGESIQDAADSVKQEMK